MIVVDATTRASDAWQKRFHERFTQTHTHNVQSALTNAGSVTGSVDESKAMAELDADCL